MSFKKIALVLGLGLTAAVSAQAADKTYDYDFITRILALSCQHINNLQ